MKFYAAAYARTSKDDSDSSSIENQIELICNSVKSMPDISVVSVREDNGFSGVDFLRPSFREMMKDIEAGKVNCVIVKDLSRLGRNYIEVGELMEEIFPRYNVRLIALTDNYDSINPRSDADEILIPFRNLYNEQYARDASGKIRAILSSKREKGEFVGAFAPYGYKRGEDDDKHRLVIDQHAAEVVRDIFRLKVEGMSGQRIAQRLNELGEPSPAEYKKRTTNYKAQFQTKSRAMWSAKAVSRIHSNPVYIGVLTQGKQTTPNYKVKRRINRAEDEWSVTPDAHEPIISKRDFEIVNALLRQDTRTAPKKESVYPLSGMVYCGTCNNNMVRTKSGLTRYYVCASSRTKNKTCTSHCIQEERLSNVVLESIACQIICAHGIQKALTYVQLLLPPRQKSMLRLSAQLADREQEIILCEKYKRSLYEDYKSEIIFKEDYIQFGKDYRLRIKELEQAVAMLQEESKLLDTNSSAYEWLAQFVQHKGINTLTRKLAVALVERVVVFNGKKISIDFRWGGGVHNA